MKTTTPPFGLANLGPIAQLRAGRLPERLLRLLLGLWLYGLAIALMIEGAVGASPWDVFHLGASLHLPLSFGMVMIVTAVAVLLAWIPLRQMPGLGTVANTLLLGPFADVNLALLGAPDSLPLRCAYLLGGVLVCALATALYVGAQLGPGPRDGLMTGLSRRTGWSIRRVRTVIEVAVLIVGVLLGGTVGVGTVVFALGVGPATQFFLRYLVVRLDAPTGRVDQPAGETR
ncbi:membrane protein YczE [Pseudoxanthomonas wuyuanensis]